MTAKHTTWSAKGTAGHEIHGQWAVYDSDGRDIAIVYDGEANGPMIAAAPELYAACKAVTEQAQRINDIQHAGQRVWPELWADLYQLTERAKAALAKVEAR